MDGQQDSENKNVAAQHHDEMAREHDRDGHRLEEEHREPDMPAHRQETAELLHEQESHQ